MIVYRDVISGDEMISDSFKLLEVIEDGVKVRDSVSQALSSCY